MRVFIAEKPSVARAIAAILPGPQQRHRTHIASGEANVVVWCAGHLLTPYLPEDYDTAYKTWRLDPLPIVPTDWRLKIAPGTRDLYQTIKHYLPRATLIVHAGDPDREGQLLVDEVLESIGIKVPVKRLLISDLNAVAVKRALGKLEDNAAYAGLSDAARGRTRADWLYGLNLTRLYTLKGQASGHSGVLSVGRVQTPVLGLVVRRDRAIAAFVSKPFYELTVALTAENGSFEAQWVPSERHDRYRDEDGRVIERAVVEQLAATLQGQSGTIERVTAQHRREPPPLPFSLPELQKIASKGRGLSPKKTLAVAQSLYEKHQVLTYPRSDCAYLPVDHWAEGGVVRDAIAQSVGHQHKLYAMTEAVNLVRLGRCWNDDKVTAHHAIIPTSRWVPLDKLTADECWIYEVVAHRYLLQFCADRAYDQTDVVAVLEGKEGIERFRARGRVDTQAGWRQYGALLMAKRNRGEKTAERDGITPLPPLRHAERLTCQCAEMHAKQTSPPKHFTEATLLDAMTSIARYVQDPEIKAILKETDGLGTPATQAGIIDILFKRGYLEKARKAVLSTALGRDMVDALPEAITLPDMTARWEKQLARIADNGTDVSGFLTGVAAEVRAITAHAKAQGNRRFAPSPGTGKTTPKPPTRQATPCPGDACSGRLRRIKGKKGYFWGCTRYGEGCRETRPDQRGKPAATAKKAQAKQPNQAVVSVGEVCPECKQGTVQQRVLKNGKNAGKPFLGCSNFPNCNIPNCNNSHRIRQ